MPIIPDGVYTLTKPNENGATAFINNAPPVPNSLVFVLPIKPDDEFKVSTTLGLEQLPSLNHFLFCISGLSGMSATGTLSLRTLLQDSSLDIGAPLS